MSVVTVKTFRCNACDKAIVPGQKYVTLGGILQDPADDEKAVHYHNSQDDSDLNCWGDLAPEDMVSDLNEVIYYAEDEMTAE